MEKEKELPSTYHFQSNQKDVSIEFHRWPMQIGEDDLRSVTYCSIAVCEDGKWEHYHAGVVRNPHDRECKRTGYFLAYKKALEDRWLYRNLDIDFDVYYRFWAHYLAQLMDGKSNDNNTNSL